MLGAAPLSYREKGGTTRENSFKRKKHKKRKRGRHGIGVPPGIRNSLLTGLTEKMTAFSYIACKTRNGKLHGKKRKGKKKTLKKKEREGKEIDSTFKPTTCAGLPDN